MNHDQSIQKDSVLSISEKVKYSIEQLIPPINLPSGFRLDRIQRNDTARNLSIFVSVPISGISHIDKVVFEGIEKQKNDFIKGLDERIKEDKEILNTVNSDFQAAPISVFKDNKVTSVLFLVSCYYGGAPHPVSRYYSFNFDNRSLKRIYFSDFFTVKTRTDSNHIKDLITMAVGREGIFVSDVKDIDFNIEEDTISFNFDDYEIASYAEGIIQGRMHRKVINENIRTIYR